ncbi:hypothetical protein SAMN05421505_10129 [Sinosporangium album]|uniref:Uncharacterized protein n=1 Tax=Sinosporangium album TaxID=504805 RepID=A0A1G7QKU8_9ACTN|nr:hypothetical protein [Sinosporangium album]SDF99167.1 hypothetical protein SAMN05421505_10129 [Sinosporangium album]
MAPAAPPGRAATADWGPVTWTYTAEDAPEAVRVEAGLATSGPSPWPAHDRVPLRVRSARHTAGLERLEQAAGGLLRRLREEYYRPAPDGAWVRCDRRPPHAAEPGLPRHALAPGEGRWVILHEDGTGAATRAKVGDIALRALVAAELTARGGVTVHASAATDGAGRAVAFLGDPGAGKSTLALHLARTGGGFLSGDRTVLVPGPGGWWAVTSGLLPRFRWGTLDGLGLGDQVRDAVLLRHGDARRRVGDLPRTPAKVVFTPREAEGVLGARTLDCAPLGRLVVLYGTRRDSPAAHALGHRQALAAVREHLLPSDAGCLERPPRDPAHLPPLGHEVTALALAWDPLRHPAGEALAAALGDGPGTAEAPSADHDHPATAP